MPAYDLLQADIFYGFYFNLFLKLSTIPISHPFLPDYSGIQILPTQVFLHSFLSWVTMESPSQPSIYIYMHRVTLVPLVHGG